MGKDIFKDLAEKHVLRFWRKNAFYGFGGKLRFCDFGEKYVFVILAGKHNFIVLAGKCVLAGNHVFTVLAGKHVFAILAENAENAFHGFGGKRCFVVSTEKLVLQFLRKNVF